MADPSAFMHKRNSSRAGPIELQTAPSPARSHRRTRSRSFFSNVHPEDEDDIDGFRTIRVNNYAANTKKNFVTNELRTAKYNAYNMIPKALFEQFKRVSNFYFLIIAVIAYLPDVSPTLPITQSLPLLVVVGFGFARDIYEDLKRASTDRKSNAKPKILLSRENPALPMQAEPSKKGTRKTRNTALPEEEALQLRAARLNPADHIMVRSRDISVGDIALVRKGETFACDMVLLKSSAEGGVAYVSTANLDGESNLKRVVVAEAVASANAVEDLRSSRAVIRAQQPAPILHEFDAKMQSSNEGFTPLDSSNLLLRGSILRNTEYIYGAVVYTGYDTKVALNMRHPPSKMGDIEKKLNWVVLLLFIFLMIIVIVSSGISGFLQSRFGGGQWYMSILSQELGLSAGFRGLGTFLILFSTFIPVSLFVTLEFVRLVQGVFISADPRLQTGDQPAVARSTNLNETLGTIQHILTDKTGTLTENIMRYVACSAGGQIYDIMQRKSAMRRAIAKDVKEVKRLVWAMALCHSVVPEPKSEATESGDSDTPTKDIPRRGLFQRRSAGSGSDDPDSSTSSKKTRGDNEHPDYQGQSPDEVALVTVARDYGVALLRRTMNTYEIDNFGRKESYTVLAELEFNSDRKRMSVILQCPDGKIRVITKGADTIMLELLVEGNEISTIQAHVDHFAKQGLRTLLFATKVISKSEFETWYKDFLEARSSLENREQLVDQVSARMEQDLEYLAVTAVEDKLQDRVPETIKFMREADIRLWVLTGDKRETAENIGYSANLLDRMMAVVHIKATNKEDCFNQMKQVLDDHCGSPATPHHRKSESLNSLSNLVSPGKRTKGLEKELGIIIDGASLKYAIEEYPDTYMQLADHAKTVICCRVTPLQKALCVRMVRELRQCMTLAIGDGGNDVSMIQEAHIGVGIFGKEGTQAARSGDYAIGEFKHLRQLVAVHGRYSQIRTAGLINLCFYKNLFFTLTQVYFQIFCFVSGTTFNNQWLTSAFNVVVTSMSPFVYGIFEKDLDETTLYRFPSAYASSRDRGCFSIRSVAEYAVLYGGWHSIAVFFGVFFCFGSLKINHSDGLDSGFDLVAFVATTLIVCMSLFKFFFDTYIQNWIFYLTLILSFGFYVLLVPLSVWVVNEQPLNGLIPMMLRSPSFWITALVIFVAGYIVDFFVLIIRRLLYPDTTYALQKWEQQQRRKTRALKAAA